MKWEYIYNGCYFDVKTTDTPLSAVSVFHNDGTPEDVREFTKEEAEAICIVIVDALNRKEIKQTLS